MSGSQWSTPLAVQPGSVIPMEQAQADLAQKQGQIGLIGQQVQAAKIQNALAGLRVNAIAPLLGGSAPATPGGGALAAPNPSIATAPGGSGAPGPQPISPYGAVMSPFGVAVPGIMAVQALTSADPTKAWESAIATRARTLSQMMAPVDPNNPGQWNQALQTAYGSGWISPDDYASLYNHPEHKQALLNSLADPNQHIETLRTLAGQGMQLDANGNAVPAAGAQAGLAGAAGARAGAEAGVKLQYAGPTAAAQTAGTASESRVPVTVDVKGADGSVTPTQYLPRDVPAVLARNPGSSVAPVGSAGMLGNFKSAIFGQESSNGAKAGTSSAGAVGNTQIMPGTFAQYAKPGEKFADSVDRDTVSQRAIDSLWQQTGGDPMRTAVGYFSGPGNIAPPGSPNPWKQDIADTDGTKTSDYVKQTMIRMLNAPTPPVAPVAGAGVTKLSPQGNAQLENTKATVAADRTDVTESLAAAQSAQKAQTQLLQVRDLIPQINTGSMATAAQSVQNYLATFAPDAAQRFAAAITASKIDPTKAGATQEFVKLTLQQAGLAERETLGARGGLGAIQLYQRAFPNIEMQPGAIQDMTNLLLIAHQRDVDYGQGVNSYFGNNSAAAFTPGGHYNPVRNFDAGFLQSNPPQVYVGAAAALNGKPFEQWAHSLTPAQQQEAIRTVWRADPSAVLTGPGGQRYTNPALAAAQ